MEIIDVVKLDENGVDVKDKNYGTPGETKYFDDNGGLPNGNFDEDNLEGSWILIDGKVDFDNIEYAYRNIDDTTLIKVEKLIERLKGKTMIEGAEWFEKNDPELLEWVTGCEYWGRGYDKEIPPEKAVIELHFTEDGVDIYATFKGHKDDDCPSRNQPAWNPRGDQWSDWEETPKLIMKYYQKVCK